MTAPAVPSNRVRLLREALHLSQAEVATRAGLTVATVRAVEHGKHPPSLATAHALQRAFGAGSLDALFPHGDD
jgi:transcriptional regulator with XRE-family HTH domain